MKISNMKICFVGLENLPVLAPEFNQHGIGGEQVQQTLLAKAFARQNHAVSMVVYDYGQPDCACWNGVKTYKAFREDSGIPVVRFIYPRWTTVWSALRRANADIYYVSCAGMHLGLVALFCKKYHKKFVFRIASDTDCEPNKLLIKYWRDRKLYEFGLRHADGILAQSQKQQDAMLRNYGLQSQAAGMLVDPSEKVARRDVDVLWVSNLRRLKRPELFLTLAKRLPHLKFHMVGGPLQGEGELFEKIHREAAHLPNFTFHGLIPYHQMDSKYASARVLVNTSDTEGFPNSYLQAWIRGTPVAAFFDPDNVIRRESLGRAVSSLDEMADAVSELVHHESVWSAASARCKDYMERVHGESSILSPYLEMFQRLA